MGSASALQAKGVGLPLSAIQSGGRRHREGPRDLGALCDVRNISSSSSLISSHVRGRPIGIPIATVFDGFLTEDASASHKGLT